MVAHKYKCVFVHIPKCAGTSIEKKLGLSIDESKRGYQDHRTIRELTPRGIWEMSPKEILRFKFKKKLKYLYHGQFDQLIFTAKQYNSYYKFTVIRNPWDRVYSWYKNVKRDRVHQKRYGVSFPLSFEEFVKNDYKMTELKSQLFWLIDKNGSIPFDYIARFENLEDDLQKVFEILGIPDRTLPAMQQSGDESSYREAYTPEIRDIISRRYEDEIKKFKYEF